MQETACGIGTSVVGWHLQGRGQLGKPGFEHLQRSLDMPRRAAGLVVVGGDLIRVADDVARNAGQLDVGSEAGCRGEGTAWVKARGGGLVRHGSRSLVGTGPSSEACSSDCRGREGGKRRRGGAEGGGRSVQTYGASFGKGTRTASSMMVGGRPIRQLSQRSKM